MNHHKITSLLLAPLNGPLIERRKNSFLTETLMSTTCASNFEDTMITPQLTPTSVVPILHVLHSDGHQAAPPNNEVQPSVGGKITADQGVVLCSTIQRFADECSPVVQKKRSSDEVVESNTMVSERIFHRKCKSSVCPTSKERVNLNGLEEVNLKVENGSWPCSLRQLYCNTLLLRYMSNFNFFIFPSTLQAITLAKCYLYA